MSDNEVRARHSALSFSVTCLMGSLLALAAWYAKNAITLWQWQFAVAVNATIVLGMVFFKKAPQRVSITAILTCAAVTLFASGYSNKLLAASGERFDAFHGYKLVAITIAIIAPFPAWVGFAIIAFCAVAPIVQYQSFPLELRNAFAVQEPWATVVYACIAGYILRHRIKGLVLERLLIQSNAEKESLSNVARVCLSLRDLTNTPLQAIELTSKLLATNMLEAKDASLHLETSLVRLRELSKLLSQCEPYLDWTKATESFDAISNLAKDLRQDLATKK
jgi:hypothetical protein